MTSSCTIADALRNVTEGRETVIDVLKEQLEGESGNRLIFHIGSRELQPEAPSVPQRAEPPSREHVFHDTLSFAAYLSRFRTETTVVFVDSSAQVMTAVLGDPATERCQPECIFMRPLVHPRFRAWRDLLEDGTMDILRFSEFCMKHRRDVTAPAGKELALLLSQIRADSMITTNRGRCINGVMIETKIQGTVKDEPVDLPDSISLNVPLFIGSESREIELDLLVTSPKPGLIVVSLTSADVIEAIVADFSAMITVLVQKVGEQVLIAQGSPRFGTWEYVA